MRENTKEEIAQILQNNTAWCPQAGCYIIHGAIEKVIEKIDQEKRSTAAKAIAWVLNNTDGRTSLDIERTVSEYINSL